MSNRYTLKDHFRESRLINDRLIFAVLFAGLLFVIVLVRLAVLQVIEHEHFNLLATKNRVDILPLAPQRGLIYDRNGVLLAENIPIFSLELTPENVPDLTATLNELATLFVISDEELAEIKLQIKHQRGFHRYIFRQRLTEQEVALFSVNRYRFPGVEVVGRLIRHYPQGALFAHTVGYVGRINEKDKKDYNGSVRTCVCPQKPNKNYKFDAWDTFRGINDRNISTKIAGQNFSLTLASLNETNDGYQDFNGTVCTQISGTNSWVKSNFQDKNTTTISFNEASAMRDTNVTIVWKKDVNEICPLTNETNTTISTDNFAIRPDKFDLTLPTLGYAGENFTIDCNASSVNSYNETLGTSFIVDSNETKAGCKDGNLSLNNFSFINGVKNSVDANYSDVGDINITIKERLGHEFAIVDSVDTNDSDRLIAPATKTMTIKPYELNVTNVEYNTTTGQDWLYMADVNNLSQRVKATIVANDKQHNLVQNFTGVCYAQDVNVTTNFAVNNTNTNVLLKYDDNSAASIADINKTVTIPKASFLTSKANLDYSFNIQRDSKIPYNPIMIGLRNIDITSTTIAKNENNATVNKNTDFYYGRVKVEDISTNKQSVPHSLHVEVYDSANSLTMKQNSLHWYINANDNDTNVTAFNAKENFTFASDKNGVGINSIESMTDGVINFTIDNSWLQSDSAMIHLDVPMWLWYSKYNSYNSVNDCSYHPCFEYRYIVVNGTSGIQSGTFQGSNIGRDYNATKQKIGVKTFR